MLSQLMLSVIQVNHLYIQTPLMMSVLNPALRFMSMLPYTTGQQVLPAGIIADLTVPDSEHDDKF